MDSTAASEQCEAREYVSCPLCGSEARDFALIARDRLFAQPGAYPVAHCMSCGLRYLSQRPTLSALGAHYPESYFPYKSLQDEHPVLRPFARWFEDLHWSRSLSRIERVIGPIPASAKVVDVGCGLNHLLARLQRVRGCLGIGVEFKPEVADYVRKVRNMPVVAGSLHDARFDSGEFDLVTMNGYLEHEPFPREMLTETRRILKRGGHVSISVPQADSLPARLFGSRWAQIDAPRHLIHFTPDTISKMLTATGYRVVHVRSYGIPFAIGLSVLQALGRRRMGALGLFDSILAPLMSLPFLPATPWLGEFMCIHAQAE